MTKEALVEAVAKVCDSKAQAARAVDAMVDAVSKSLASGQKVTITGFGTFLVSQRAARTGRNPQTGASIQIPAMKVPRFKAGKALKDAVK
jgi:DNA-binding protein HU-beta